MLLVCACVDTLTYIEDPDEKVGINDTYKRYYLINGALQKEDGPTEVEGENAGLYYLEQGQLKSVKGVYANSADGKLYYFSSGRFDNTASGLGRVGSDGYYLRNGIADTSFTGMSAVSENGRYTDWYYVKNGRCVGAETGEYYYYTGFALVDGKESYHDGKEGYYYVKNNQVQWDLAGLNNINGTWYYFKNGQLEDSYTGLVSYNNSWFYVENGKINWSYSGLAQVNGKGNWYRVENGKINWNYNGLVNFNGGWYYLQGGILNWKYTNLVKYNGTWYYVKNSTIDWKCTTLAQVNGKGAWYYVKNGAIDWKYTGLAQVDGKGTWYRVENGKLNWNYNGLVNFNGGWYYIQGGKLNWNYSNLVQYKGSWYYVRNGKIDWNYTTLAQVNGKGAWYYVKNGAIDWKYTGLAQVDGKGTYYYVQNGKLNWNANRIWYTSDGTRYDVKNGVATKYVHQHTWKTETKTIHHDALTVWEETFKCKCGYETTDVDEFNSHIEKAEEEALSYAHTDATVAEKKLYEHIAVASEGITRTVAEAYDKTITIKRCSTCGETNENDGHEHQWVIDKVINKEAVYNNIEYASCSCGQFFSSVSDYNKHKDANTNLVLYYISENQNLVEAIYELHQTSSAYTWKKLISNPYREIVSQKCAICGKIKE